MLRPSQKQTWKPILLPISQKSEICLLRDYTHSFIVVWNTNQKIHLWGLQKSRNLSQVALVLGNNLATKAPQGPARYPIRHLLAPCAAWEEAIDSGSHTKTPFKTVCDRNLMVFVGLSCKVITFNHVTMCVLHTMCWSNGKKNSAFRAMKMLPA